MPKPFRLQPLRFAIFFAVASLLLLQVAAAQEVSNASQSSSGANGAKSLKGQVESVAPGVWRIRFGQVESFTPVSMRQDAPPPCTEALAALPNGELPFSAANIRFRVEGRGCAVDLPMEKAEQIFGFGLQLRAVNHTGTRQTIRTSDNPATGLGDSHAPVPFYVSNRGYGVFVDTLRDVSFFCGNLARSGAGVTAPSHTTSPGNTAENTSESEPADSTDALYRQRDIKDSVMSIDIPSAHGVDIYIFAGPTPKLTVQRYNLFSGGGCLPPLWGLGVYYRAHTEMNAEDVLKFARDFRENHIPCDVFGLEPGWHSAAYSCSFAWNPKKWPDPAGFIKTMTGMHYELNLWEHIFTHPTSPLFEALKPYSGDYLVWNGLVPDFATSQAREIFGGYHERELIQKGIAGFKIDECDHQPLSATPWSFPDHSVFPSGLDGEQMHALLGLMHQRLFDSIYRRNNIRTYGKVRASHALAAPMPYVVYSDHYEHHDYVRGTVNSGFGGLLWSPEVRESTNLTELYRRMQTSVFSAQTVINAWYLKNPPWRQIDKDRNNRGEFMDGWQQSESICRGLFELRMKLIPYLYSAFAEYHSQGVPPFRALAMDYPEDENTWKIDDQYMMGPSLMVAPLFSEQNTRIVYLPKGVWYDFWTHQKYQGGEKIRVNMKDVTQMPVFVKGGSMIPLAQPVEYVTPDTCFELTIHVFGDQPGRFTLYEDDGISYDFERGRQNRIELNWTSGKGDLQKTGQYTGPARYKIVDWQSTP
jgi:alpha-D-xyloside xylohydrolase